MLEGEVVFENSVKCPSFDDIIHKDECIYCFDNMTFPGGIYVCLMNWDCFCERHVFIPKKNGFNKFFLNIIADKKPHNELELKKVGINIDGGYNPHTKYNYSYNICYINDDMKLIKQPYKEDCFPKIIVDTVSKIISKCSTQIQMALMMNNWDGEKLLVTKFSDCLKQNPLPDNYTTPNLKDIKCEYCEKTNNLWINLTDGKILCGRKYYDGSGGNNHAMEHYKNTGFPLTVKLGTICKTGADVYSYDEDDMVIDLNLEQHLLHFGIDMKTMNVTEKTMSELTLEANKNLTLEDDSILENGYKLEPAYGPGFTGMVNLGNSCYISSIFQLLCSIDEFKNQFNYDPAIIFPKYDNSYWNDPIFQIYKLVYSLECGRYSIENDTKECAIKPYALKAALCTKGSIFHGNEQHDVMEFLLFLMQKLEDLQKSKYYAQLNRLVDIRHLFSFKIHNFIRQLDINNIDKNTSDITERVSVSSEVFLSIILDTENVHIPSLDHFIGKRTSNHNENNENLSFIDFRKHIPWDVSYKYLLKDHYEESIGTSVRQSRIRFRTFPKYLLAAVCRYTVENGLPIKLDYDVDMPKCINFGDMISDNTKDDISNDFSLENDVYQQIDQSLLNELLSFGFEKVICENALIAKPGGNIEDAVNWIIENQQNPDAFKSPKTRSMKQSNQKFSPDSEKIASIVAMGFDTNKTSKALTIANNNIDEAINLLLSGVVLDKLLTKDDNVDNNSKTDTMEQKNLANITPKSLEETYDISSDVIYKLKGFISHIGKSTSYGHYVCHTIKNNQIYLFNDENVAKSVSPPINLGYIYLYERQ